MELQEVKNSTVKLSTPTLSFLQAGCPSYRPINSARALKGKVPSL